MRRGTRALLKLRGKKRCVSVVRQYSVAAGSNAASTGGTENAASKGGNAAKSALSNRSSGRDKYKFTDTIIFNREEPTQSPYVNPVTRMEKAPRTLNALSDFKHEDRYRHLTLWETIRNFLHLPRTDESVATAFLDARYYRYPSPGSLRIPDEIPLTKKGKYMGDSKYYMNASRNRKRFQLKYADYQMIYRPRTWDKERKQPFMVDDRETLNACRQGYRFCATEEDRSYLYSGPLPSQKPEITADEAAEIRRRFNVRIYQKINPHSL
eukprot:TRINITY_DN7000_c0_g1_i1.p1 TRINITY_DN7000_c0_g1~~TRINITY_DN7000_c0_g1_i1.p1  ORF type:complete len:267 (+),score=42.23 TRINITY_DN7000_c0_g1_i1:11-811(+)